MTEFFHFASGSLLLPLLALFLATFIHEDIAIVSGALLIVEHEFSFPLALAAIFSGIVVSDVAVYSLGVLARRAPWARRRFVGPNVAAAEQWLRQRFLRLMVLCRLVPGMLFPTFVACGWFGVPLRRFLLLSVVTAGLYAPLMLLLVQAVGASLLSALGYWAWLLVLVWLLGITFAGSRHPRWDWLSKSRPSPQGRSGTSRPFRAVSFAEKVPAALFYLPVILRWFVLALRHRSLTLPTAANPCIEGGGFWGESKSRCLRSIAAEQQHRVAPFITLERRSGPDSVKTDLDRALQSLSRAGLDFPLAAKPDIGWQGFGVRKLDNAEQLREYIAAFPPTETLILQQVVPHDGEAAIFYIRRPDRDQGEIIGLALRYFPHVLGDGRSSLRELILRDPRSSWKARFHLGRHRQHRSLSDAQLARVPAAGERVRLSFIGSIRIGGLYRDGKDCISEALQRRIDAIARSMPEFHFGRFDVRFQSIEQLQRGEGFVIIEINGAGSEPIHAWDPDKSIFDLYGELFRVQSRLFEIGDLNRARGFSPMPLRAFFSLMRHQHRLITHYPPSG